MTLIYSFLLAIICKGTFSQQCRLQACNLFPSLPSLSTSWLGRSWLVSIPLSGSVWWCVVVATHRVAMELDNARVLPGSINHKETMPKLTYWWVNLMLMFVCFIESNCGDPPALIQELSHPAKSFSELQGEKIVSVSCSEFFSSLMTQSGKIFWW